MSSLARAELERVVEALDDSRVARVEQVLVHDGYATEDVEVTHAADAFSALDAAGPASFPVMLERLRATDRASLRRAILDRLRLRRLWAGEHAARVDAELRAWIAHAPVDDVPAVVAALDGVDVRSDLLARIAREAAPADRVLLLRAVPRSLRRPTSSFDAQAWLLADGTLDEAHALAPLATAERARALLAAPATQERALAIFSSFAEPTREALMPDLLDLAEDPRLAATLHARIRSYPLDTPSMRRLRATRGDVSWAEPLVADDARCRREVLAAIADPLVPEAARVVLVAIAERTEPKKAR